MSGENEIVLVNDLDEVIGYEQKMKVHKNGLLHRAFSVLIFNLKNEMLLQKRNRSKYHSGSLWTNACCGHPKQEQVLKEAAEKRLFEEMGLNCKLNEIFNFRYYHNFSNGLTENEIDHVFIGYSDCNPSLNPIEAEDYKWISLDEVEKDISQSPEEYTYWFKIILQKYLDQNNKKEEFRIFSTILKIKTQKEFELIDITREVASFLESHRVNNGVINIFSKHTTLAIKINEFEPLLIKDFTEFADILANYKEDYLHDHIELRPECPKDEPKNARGHIICLFSESSQAIPIVNGFLQLGKYQSVFVIETSGPRERDIILQVIGNT
ncbi:MAG: isopentenyl-diphosphate Delta-isomerase [Nanoarchaeota archaeon]